MVPCVTEFDVAGSMWAGPDVASDMDGVETTPFVDVAAPMVTEDSEMPEYFSDDEEMAGIAEDLAFLDSIQEQSSAMEVDVPLFDVHDATAGVQSLQVTTDPSDPIDPTTQSKGGGAA